MTAQPTTIRAAIERTRRHLLELEGGEIRTPKDAGYRGGPAFGYLYREAEKRRLERLLMLIGEECG